MRAAGGTEAGQITLLMDLALDPNTTTNSSLVPTQWKPYALNYDTWDNSSAPVATQLLLGQAMDDGTAAASFEALNVNFGLDETNDPSAYTFSSTDPDGLITNTATAYTGGAGPLYGMGAEPWQRYTRFETRAFPLLGNPTAATYDVGSGTISQPNPIDWKLLSGTNDLLLRPGAIPGVSANDTLLGRVAVTPSEARIEASIFAEQGSFFVIPGPWFNPNPNDTHAAYAQRIADLQTNSGLTLAQAEIRENRDRLEAYGTAPEAPFYGEPLDVRLNIVGSVAENLPPAASVQAEWERKWGWIPRRTGAPGTPNQSTSGAWNPHSARPGREPVLPGGNEHDPGPELRAQPDYPIRPCPGDRSLERQLGDAESHPHGRLWPSPAADAPPARQPQAFLLRRHPVNPLRRLLQSTALLGLAAFGARAGAQTQSFVQKTHTINAAVLLLDADKPGGVLQTTNAYAVYGQTAAPFAFYKPGSDARC